MKNLTDKKAVLSAFQAARTAKDWDKAQQVIDQAKHLFPADTEIEEARQDFLLARICYDTLYVEA